MGFLFAQPVVSGLFLSEYAEHAELREVVDSFLLFRPTSFREFPLPILTSVDF